VDNLTGGLSEWPRADEGFFRRPDLLVMNPFQIDGRSGMPSPGDQSVFWFSSQLIDFEKIACQTNIFIESLSGGF